MGPAPLAGTWPAVARRSRRALAGGLWSAMLLLAACASSKDLEPETFRTDLSGLEPFEYEGDALVYVLPGRRTLGEFDRFLVDPVQVPLSDRTLSESVQISKMRGYLHTAVCRELRAHGYQVASFAGEDVLRILFRLYGMESGGAVGGTASTLLNLPVGVGTVTIESELVDSLSGERYGVILSRARSGFQPAALVNRWAELEEACDGWARRFRRALDAAHTSETGAVPEASDRP